MAYPKCVVRELTIRQCEALAAVANDPGQEPRKRIRARILIACAQPRTLAEIAADAGCSLSTVRKTLQEFDQSGDPMQSLGKALGRGALCTPDTEKKIAALARSKPGWGAGTIAKLAIHRGWVSQLSHETCRQILIRQGVRVCRKRGGHEVEYF